MFDVYEHIVLRKVGSEWILLTETPIAKKRAEEMSQRYDEQTMIVNVYTGIDKNKVANESVRNINLYNLTPEELEALRSEIDEEIKRKAFSRGLDEGYIRQARQSRIQNK